jgi:integrase
MQVMAVVPSQRGVVHAGPLPTQAAPPDVRVVHFMPRAAQSPKVLRVCPHGLRGTHATLAEEAGTSGTVVAKSLGHENHRVTEEHYLAPGTTKKVAAQKTMQVLVGTKEPDRGNS